MSKKKIIHLPGLSQTACGIDFRDSCIDWVDGMSSKTKNVTCKSCKKTNCYKYDKKMEIYNALNNSRT